MRKMHITPCRAVSLGVLGFIVLALIIVPVLMSSRHLTLRQKW